MKKCIECGDFFHADEGYDDICSVCYWKSHGAANEPDDNYDSCDGNPSDYGDGSP